jgi:hypothetical protein
VYRTLELRVQTTAAAQRLRESTALQRTLQTRHLGAHVRPAPDCAARGVAGDDAVGAPHQPHQLALGAALTTAHARADRDMLHASAGGCSPSAAVTSATGSGVACAATHASAAA